eukprot:TRINITY_DN8202_c0_g1_i1.p1 TRINITY_DN8202_c0_g1~~TRINITY_DN8202_c0_g1_i1.p1  ORF type:complete len:859 (+),score=114.69 TRINITY_DN8202_c0_g1_i1:129-2705(+)
MRLEGLNSRLSVMRSPSFAELLQATAADLRASAATRSNADASDGGQKTTGTRQVQSAVGSAVVKTKLWRAPVAAKIPPQRLTRRFKPGPTAAPTLEPQMQGSRQSSPLAPETFSKAQPLTKRSPNARGCAAKWSPRRRSAQEATRAVAAVATAAVTAACPALADGAREARGVKSTVVDTVEVGSGSDSGAPLSPNQPQDPLLCLAEVPHPEPEKDGETIVVISVMDQESRPHASATSSPRGSVNSDVPTAAASSSATADAATAEGSSVTVCESGGSGCVGGTDSTMASSPQRPSPRRPVGQVLQEQAPSTARGLRHSSSGGLPLDLRRSAGPLEAPSTEGLRQPQLRTVASQPAAQFFSASSVSEEASSRRHVSPSGRPPQLPHAQVHAGPQAGSSVTFPRWTSFPGYPPVAAHPSHRLAPVVPLGHAAQSRLAVGAAAPPSTMVGPGTIANHFGSLLASAASSAALPAGVPAPGDTKRSDSPFRVGPGTVANHVGSLLASAASSAALPAGVPAPGDTKRSDSPFRVGPGTFANHFGSLLASAASLAAVPAGVPAPGDTKQSDSPLRVRSTSPSIFLRPSSSVGRIPVSAAPLTVQPQMAPCRLPLPTHSPPQTARVLSPVAKVKRRPSPEAARGDAIDAALSVALGDLDAEAAILLNVRRIAPGRYLFDGRSTTVSWANAERKELVVREDCCEDGRRCVPLDGYLAQAANVATAVREARGKSPELADFKLTFDDASCPDLERTEAMKLACDQVRLRHTARLLHPGGSPKCTSRPTLAAVLASGLVPAGVPPASASSASVAGFAPRGSPTLATWAGVAHNYQHPRVLATMAPFANQLGVSMTSPRQKMRFNEHKDATK